MCSEREDLCTRLLLWAWCLGRGAGKWEVTNGGTKVPTSKSSITISGAVGRLLLILDWTLEEGARIWVDTILRRRGCGAAS